MNDKAETDQRSTLACPSCEVPVTGVQSVVLAGATVVQPCGHEVVATRYDTDPPGLVRLTTPPASDGGGDRG